jgi:hypothetical protein
VAVRGVGYGPGEQVKVTYEATTSKVAVICEATVSETESFQCSGKILEDRVDSSETSA